MRTEPKKTATSAATEPTKPTAPAATGDPLANLAAKLEADNAKVKALHLATYRAAVKVLASGRSLAPEEEEPVADALRFFELNTDALKRDVATVKTIESLKKNLGETPEDRARRSTASWEKVKLSAANLEKMREALKRAEEEHMQLVRQSDGHGSACVELDRLRTTNPRIFAADWPPAPKAEVPPVILSSQPQPAQPPQPPQPPTEIVHPLTGKVVPVSATKLSELVKSGQFDASGFDRDALDQNAAMEQRSRELLEKRATLEHKARDAGPIAVTVES
jgi:hypothetical protein